MSARKYHIGNIDVHRRLPPNNNPYRGHGDPSVHKPLERANEPVTSVCGDERVAALTAFKRGSLGEYTFWYAPASGGARRIYDPAEVDWVTSGIP